jgi:hypothetical protein
MYDECPCIYTHTHTHTHSDLPKWSSSQTLKDYNEHLHSVYGAEAAVGEGEAAQKPQE